MIKKELSRLCKNSLIYGIGGALNRFIGLLLLPFFTRVLSPEDYGIVALLSIGSSYEWGFEFGNHELNRTFVL